MHMKRHLYGFKKNIQKASTTTHFNRMLLIICAVSDNMMFMFKTQNNNIQNQMYIM